MPSKMIYPEYRDKNGTLIKPGDFIRFDNGSVELVYLTDNPNGGYDLGINASSLSYIERHPFSPRECYPLHQFNHMEYELLYRSKEGHT